MKRDDYSYPSQSNVLLKSDTLGYTLYTYSIVKIEHNVRSEWDRYRKCGSYLRLYVRHVMYLNPFNISVVFVDVLGVVFALSSS